MTLEKVKPKKFVLTTPLYYANDLPHVGSAYTTMIADVISRYKKLKGEEVLFITGADEHGQKIERNAEANNLPAQEHCDRIVSSFKLLWDKLDIQYDHFSRTTDTQHQKIVYEFFQRVWDNDDIYLSRQQGWYCVACEEFKEERELLENGCCPVHFNKKAEWYDEENYFFKLSKYQSQLEELYKNNPEFIKPKSCRNEILKFVNQGLKDFSISRVNVKWGFTVPNDPNHTIYVWFDALLGYITALLESESKDSTLDNAISQGWPVNLHLIGKDILRFHAVYWPAMLMSAKLSLPEYIFGHGFLTKDGQKMGKSSGNTLDPFELVNKYGPDPIRYYFLKEIECGKDGDFNETRFINTVNADLADDLGNLLNRTLGMTQKYCEGLLPPMSGIDLPKEHPLKKIGLNLGENVIKAYDNLKFNEGCEEIFTLIRASNKFIDEQAPWTLFKKGEQKEVEKILYGVLESVRLVAYLLAPIIPNLSSKIYKQLGFSVDFNQVECLEEVIPFDKHSQWGKLAHNNFLSKPQPIFVKLDTSLKNDF